MKLIVLDWVISALLFILSRTIELLFRIILFFIPLGVFMIILQHRGNISKISSLSAFTNERSVWQHVFPGFMLVAVNPNEFKEFVVKTKSNFQSWIESNKYLLAFLFMSSIVILMILH